MASFKLHTGPASNMAPKGLQLFKASTYLIQRSERQFGRGHADARDKSELILEGYQEPHVDEKGQPYIALVTLSVISADRRRIFATRTIAPGDGQG